MADRVFPLSADRQHLDREGLHKKRFPPPPPPPPPPPTPPRGPYSLPPVYTQGEPPRRFARRRSPCCCCCCYICAIAATLLLILFVLAAILYLLLQPKAPTFSITRAYITEFNMTAEPRKGGGSKGPALYLQTNVNFTVVAGNPNKKIGIQYEQINVELDYEGMEIGEGSVLSVYVGQRESEEMELQVKGMDTLLGKRVGLGLQKAVQVGSSLWVQVKTVARVRIRVWGFQSRDAKVRIDCNVELSRPLPHSGATLLSKSCKLHALALWHLNAH
eukprot:c11244_g1_i2 orf=9-830(-)